MSPHKQIIFCKFTFFSSNDGYLFCLFGIKRMKKKPKKSSQALWNLFRIHHLIKPFADVDHPGGEFLHGLVDEGVGHLFVIGVGHGTCDGGEGVGIATQGDGEFDAVDIVLGVKETDDGRTYRSCTGGVKCIGIVEVGVFLVCPVWIILMKDVLTHELLVLAILQMEYGECRGHCPFDALRMVVGGGGSLRCHPDAFLFRLRQPRCRGATHGRAIAQTAIGLGLMTGKPLLEGSAESRMTMFVGTLPQVHGHVQMVDKRLCTRERQHRVVSKACSAAEQLHLTVVLDAVRPTLIGTTCNISYGLTHQIILHTHDCLMLQYF